MNRRKRLLRITIISSVVILSMVIGAILYATISFYYGPVPQQDGLQQVEGISTDVTVYRDSWGIPHVYASTVEDLFFAQGFTHAQDRWWQMELSRSVGSGQLAQITGNIEQFQEIDRLMLTLGFKKAAEAEWAQASPEARKVLIAYSAGVNAYIAERTSNDLALEYGLLALADGVDNIVNLLGQDDVVSAWSPVDTLVMAKIFAWQMSGNWSQELENARLYGQLEADLLSTYLSPKFTPYTTVSDDELSFDSSPNDNKKSLPVAPLEVYQRNQLLFNTPLVGDLSPSLMRILGLENNLRGNSWVVSGERTTSGEPLLANDLQGGNTIPSTWFEMGLHCRFPSPECPYDVVGFSIAGIPAIVVGHNDKVTWGLNSLNVDDQDLYMIELNPDDPTQYRQGNRWVDMQRDVIEVEISEDESDFYNIYSTQYGSVLTNIDILLENNPLYEGDYQALVLHWSATEVSSQFLDALLALNRAQSWTDFRTALSIWHAPALNFLYADIDGNIGYQMVGNIPIRQSEHTGIVPVPANENTRWLGILDFELLPSIYNPDDGIIVNANNAVVTPDYFDHIATEIGQKDANIRFSFDIGGDFRASRIDYLLSTRELHSLDSFARMQADNYNAFADILLPYMTTVTVDDDAIIDIIAWLKLWDKQNDEASSQAVFFEVFWLELANQTFADQYVLSSDEHAMLLLQSILDQPQHPWWDDSQTPFTQETRDDIIESALRRSYNSLTNYLDSDRENWRWGDLHEVNFVSRLIGLEDLLPFGDVGRIPVNRGTYGVSGGLTSLNTTYFKIDLNPGDAVNPLDDQVIQLVPAFRMIIDLSDFNNSRSIHITGQSGHPAHENYDDMIDPWRTVEYHNMRWGQAIVDSADKQLDLKPFPSPTVINEDEGVDAQDD